MLPTVRHIDHINATVANLDDAIAFYAKVFGFVTVERVDKNPRWCVLRAADALLCLHEAPLDRPRRVPRELAICHFGLRIAGRPEDFRAHLVRVDVPIALDLEYPHSKSVYVKDPTGHLIEVAFWKDDVMRFG